MESEKNGGLSGSLRKSIFASSCILAVICQSTGPDKCTGGSGFAATPCSLLAGEGGQPEAPPEGAAGGALPEARF